MIGILTFYWADDYGALLQCYALKTYLNKYQEAILIPYFPKVLRSRYQLLKDGWIKKIIKRSYHVKQHLKALTQFYDKLVTKYKMNCFRKKYLIKSRKMLDTSRDIYKFGKGAKIDTYIVGSDQVWNPEITNGIQEGYFCTFRRWSGEKKNYITYAASMGAERLSDIYQESMPELLSNFDLISLREQQAVPYIEQLYDKPLTVVLDPIFLLEKKEWEALMKRKKKRKEKYIAVYFTEYNTAMTEYLKYLEKESGLNVLLVTSNKSDRNKSHWTPDSKYVVGCGPLEFLEMLYYAEYVVTNSFHGTALSIMFQKQFVTFSHSMRGARILNLLNLCHLEKRLGGTDRNVIDINEEIDWKMVENALIKGKMHSQEFIRRKILPRKNDI